MYENVIINSENITFNIKGEKIMSTPPISHSPVPHSQDLPVSRKKEYIVAAILVVALAAIGAGVYFAVTGGLGLGASAYLPMLIGGGVITLVSLIALAYLSIKRKAEQSMNCRPSANGAHTSNNTVIQDRLEEKSNNNNNDSRSNNGTGAAAANRLPPIMENNNALDLD